MVETTPPRVSVFHGRWGQQTLRERTADVARQGGPFVHFATPTLHDIKHGRTQVVFDTSGTAKGQTSLPVVFTAPIRPDVVLRPPIPQNKAGPMPSTVTPAVLPAES